MSPPTSPATPSTKRPWINRQLSKLNTKLHKRHPKTNSNHTKMEDPISGDVAKGREVGFSAFGAEESDEREGKGKAHEKIGVLEVDGLGASGDDEVFSDFHREVDKGEGEKVAESAGEKAGAGDNDGVGTESGAGAGTDTYDHARTHGMVPFDGGSGSSASAGERTIEGDITKNTALNSHPVAGLFRKD